MRNIVPLSLACLWCGCEPAPKPQGGNPPVQQPAGSEAEDRGGKPERLHKDPVVPKEKLTGLNLAPDKKHVLTTYLTEKPREPWQKTRSLVLWEVETGRKVWTLTRGDADVEDVRFLPDDQHFLVQTPQQLEQRRVATGKLVRAFADTADLFTFEVSIDGNLAVLGFRHPPHRIVDLKSGMALRQFGDDPEPWHFALSTDGRFVLVGTPPRPERPFQVRLWDSITGKVVRTFPTDEGWTPAFAFIPNKNQLVVTRKIARHLRTGELVVFELPTSREVQTLKGPIGKLAPSCDGRYIVSASYRSQSVDRWDIEKGALSFSGRFENDCNVPPSAFSFSRDGEAVAFYSGCGDEVRLLDTNTARTVQHLKLDTREWSK